MQCGAVRVVPNSYSASAAHIEAQKGPAAFLLQEMNADIAFYIGSFLAPNPVEYTRLALVCHDFYTAFTSDKMWSCLDPLGDKSNIMQKFLRRADDESRQDVKSAWSHKVQPTTKEPLAWLAYYTNGHFHSNGSRSRITTHAMLRCALSISHTAIPHMDPTLAWDQQSALAAVRRHGPLLGLLPTIYHSDKEIIMAACSKPYELFTPLEFASKKLRDDPQVVAKAVSLDGISLDYASRRLRSDREFVLKCVKCSGECIEFTNFFEDREIVLEAVKTYGDALGRAHKFQDDDEIVKLAINSDGLSLKYASPRLKRDREIVHLAVRETPAALNLVPQYNNDPEIMLTAIKNSYDAFFFAAPQLQESREFILQAVQANAWCLNSLPRKFINDREVLLAAVGQNGELYVHLPDFRDDFEFYKNAVASYPPAARWAPKAFRKHFIQPLLVAP